MVHIKRKKKIVREGNRGEAGRKGREEGVAGRGAGTIF